MLEINESNSFQKLTSNMNQTISQNNEIGNKDYERSQRAQQIAQITNSAFDNISNTSEWNLLLNALCRIDYAIYEPIDFNMFHVKPEIPITQPLNNQQLRNSINSLEASYKNIYDKFINRYLDQTINLPQVLKSYLQDLYLNRTIPEQNVEWSIISNQEHTSNEYDTLVLICNRLIAELIEIKLQFDRNNNNPTVLINSLNEYLNLHYPVKQSNINLKLPKQVIEYICNYSIIETNEHNLTVVNAPDSIKAFNIILISRYQIIPFQIYILNNLPDNRNIANVLSLPRQVIHLTVDENVIIPSLTEISNSSSEFEYEQIQTKHPSIAIDYVGQVSQNLQEFINLLINRYHQPEKLISPFILNPYLAEVFLVASNLFNNYDFYKGINICKYLSTQYDIAITNKEIVNQLTNPGDQYSIFNVQPIRRDNKVPKSQPPEPSTFDILYVEANPIKTPGIFKLFLICGIIAVLLISLKSYNQFTKKPSFPEQLTPRESYKLMKLAFNEYTPHPREHFINLQNGTI